MEYEGFKIPKNNSEPRVSPFAKTVLIIAGIILFLVVGTLVGKRDRTAKSEVIQMAQPIQPAQAAQTPSVEFALASVTLDYRKREMEIRGTLTNNGPSRPDRVWIWAYYFVPNSQYASGSWSDLPLPVDNPFADGNVKEVTARRHFHWADNESAPKSGYYARVSHSAVSADAATVSTELRDKTTSGARAVNVLR
jgi:hypothetical protein